MAEKNKQEEDASKRTLKDLTEVHPKLFEKHFREWMEKDGVARSLQAKLRCDLIANFNTTQLGKQLISHSATAKTGCAKRLTLSPLLLALNTLVAEFLYAQNCHFSLSVFSAEAPFHSTLPDFECTQSFRFTKLEIAQIMEAISGSTKCEDLRKSIAATYEENNDTSLIFCILKALVQQMQQRQKRTKSRDKQPERNFQQGFKDTTSYLSATVSIDEYTSTGYTAYLHEQYAKTEVRNKELTTYRLINQYLMVLAKRVKEMVMQCERLSANNQKNKPPIHSFGKIFKPSIDQYQDAVKALESVTKDLKSLTLPEMGNNRDIMNIVKAVQTLSKQFTLCNSAFEGWQNHRNSSRKSQLSDAITQTEEVTKTYSEWINDLRKSKNGQRFLDKIAAGIQKALDKQKKQLQLEADLKMHHQIELVKLHYKQKHIDQLSRNISKDQSAQVVAISEKMERQLKQYEQHYSEMITKLTEIENNSQKKINVSYLLPIRGTASSSSAHKFEVIEDSSKLDLNEKPSVDVFNNEIEDRVKELECEGNEIENKFKEYLDTEKMKKSNEYEMTQRVLKTYVKESRRIMDRYDQLKDLGNKYKSALHKISPDKPDKSEETEKWDKTDKVYESENSYKSDKSEKSEKIDRSCLKRYKEKVNETSFGRPNDVLKSESFTFTNPISEAKDSLNLNRSPILRRMSVDSKPNEDRHHFDRENDQKYFEEIHEKVLAPPVQTYLQSFLNQQRNESSYSKKENHEKNKEVRKTRAIQRSASRSPVESPPQSPSKSCEVVEDNEQSDTDNDNNKSRKIVAGSLEDEVTLSSKKLLLHQSLEKMEQIFSSNIGKDVMQEVIEKETSDLLKSMKEAPKKSSTNNSKPLANESKDIADNKEVKGKSDIFISNDMNTPNFTKDKDVFPSTSNAILASLTHQAAPVEYRANFLNNFQKNLTDNVVAFCSKGTSASSSVSSNDSADIKSGHFIHSLKMNMSYGEEEFSSSDPLTDGNDLSK